MAVPVSDFEVAGRSAVEVNKRILNLIKVLPGELERALFVEGQRIVDLAKSRTPVETGALQDSGMVTKMKSFGSHDVAVGVTFASFGQSQDYGIYVHENMEGKPDALGRVYTHEPPGQAKFLESAINDSVEGQLKRIRDNIRLERLG